MTEFEYQEQIGKIQQILTTANEETDTEIEVTDEAISDKIGEYVDARIDPEDAVRYVAEDFLDEAGITDTGQFTRGVSGSRRGRGSVDNEQLKAEEIREPNQWIEFKGTVIEVFENNTDAIAQQGRLADETGTIRFTIWDNDGIETDLERGETYHLEPVVVNEFQGQCEIKIANVTNVTKLEGDDALDIDPDEYTETISGAIVSFQDQMGLIDRCPNEDCRRVLRQVGHCPDCGDVESELDLRTKAVVDTGDDTWTIFLDEKATDELAFMDLEEAKKKAQEYNDRQVVQWAIEEELHGEYLRLHGRDRGRRFDVDEYELIPAPTVGDLREIKSRLKALP